MDEPNSDLKFGRNYSNACFDWTIYEGGKKEGSRYVYRRHGIVFLKAADKQISPVFLHI